MCGNAFFTPSDRYQSMKNNATLISVSRISKTRGVRSCTVVVDWKCSSWLDTKGTVGAGSLNSMGSSDLTHRNLMNFQLWMVCPSVRLSVSFAPFFSKFDRKFYIAFQITVGVYRIQQGFKFKNLFQAYDYHSNGADFTVWEVQRQCKDWNHHLKNRKSLTTSIAPYPQCEGFRRSNRVVSHNLNFGSPIEITAPSHSSLYSA